MGELAVPEHVHAIEDDSGCMTLLNERTGRWHVLNATAAFVWKMARSGATSSHAAEAIAARFPRTPQTQIETDVRELIEELCQRGLIERTIAAPRRKGPGAVPMEIVPRSHVAYTLKHRVAVAVSFPIAILLTWLPFSWTARLLRVLKSRLRRPVASETEACAISAAASRLADRYPGRAACYEVALTVALAAALLRRSVDMCLGAATDPRDFHAWIEVDGHAVCASSDPSPDDRYHCILLL
jgi:hypothetical protein